MDRRWQRAIEVVSLAMLAWFAFTLLSRIHAVFVLAIVVFAVCNAVVEWMLRFDRKRLAPFKANRYFKYYVDWVCRFAGTQPLLEVPAGDANGEFLLQVDQDYKNAAWRAKQVVMGHDEVVDRFLWGIRDAIILRKRQQQNSKHAPLASILLAGSEGIGKRFLTRVLAKLLFRSGSVTTFDCDTLTPQSLFGANGTVGELLEAVLKQPSQIIILERIDTASPALIRELTTVVTNGVYRLRVPNREVSFQNTILVLTTTKAISQLNALAEQALSEIVWHKKAMEVVAAESNLEPAFLNLLSDIIYCEEPTDRTKAKVTALLMTRECKQHGITLSQVDDRVIAAEVLRIDGATGFSRLPHDVKRLLSKPILEAVQHNCQVLSLRVGAARSPGNGRTND